MTRRRKSDRSPLPEAAGGPDLSIETALAGRGIAAIAGVDEAGRGPLAGPVVAAAVILHHERIPEGLNDSKKVPAAMRECLFRQIVESSDVAIAMAPAARIDAMNIRAATLWAMRRAVAGLGRGADFALIDGRDTPDGLPCPARALIRGDGRSASIAAASIVAKVTRDRLMARLGLEIPGYGFERNKGYGTAEHLEALARLGPTRIHRRSFAPVARVAAKETQMPPATPPDHDRRRRSPATP